jgi:type IV pilus assembly protein PilE
MLSSQVIGLSAPRVKSGALGRTRPGRGFTLIELLVAVAIVAILAAIAYPSYRSQISKTRRADAESVLMQAAQFMERTYTESGSYNPTGFSFPFTKSPIDGTVTYYTITRRPDRWAITIAGEPASTMTAATGFVIRADPAGGPEAGAGLIEIDSSGRRWWDKDNDTTVDSGEDSWSQ